MLFTRMNETAMKKQNAITAPIVLNAKFTDAVIKAKIVKTVKPNGGIKYKL